MIYKEFKTKNKKVLIYRQKSPIQNGYEYFIQVMTKGMFDQWVFNESYKQKSAIHSDKRAIEMAKDF